LQGGDAYTNLLVRPPVGGAHRHVHHVLSNRADECIGHRPGHGGTADAPTPPHKQLLTHTTAWRSTLDVVLALKLVSKLEKSQKEDFLIKSATAAATLGPLGEMADGVARLALTVIQEHFGDACQTVGGKHHAAAELQARPAQHWALSPTVQQCHNRLRAPCCSHSLTLLVCVLVLLALPHRHYATGSQVLRVLIERDRTLKQLTDASGVCRCLLADAHYSQPQDMILLPRTPHARTWQHHSALASHWPRCQRHAFADEMAYACLFMIECARALEHAE
jgi:hypothetical protein